MGLLTLLVVVPLVGGAGMLLLGRGRDRLVHQAGLVVSLATFALSLLVWSGFDATSAEYQFARRWFGGARFDVSGRALEDVPKDKGGSLLLTFWPSEFSQVRSQYRYTRLGSGGTNNELLFQLLFSIGAHGAHAF